MSAPEVRIQKLTSGEAVIYMQGKPLCLIAAAEAAELDALMTSIAALPLPAGRALAVANAMCAAFAFGVVAGQGALMLVEASEVCEGGAPHPENPQTDFQTSPQGGGGA